MIFFQGLIFGITLAIAIGPIALLIIRYSTNDGLYAGLSSACGAALADLTYAVIALTIGTTIAPILTGYRRQVQILSAVVLVIFGLWLLWPAICQSNISSNATKISAKAQQRGAPFFTTYLLTVANPLTVVAFLAFIGRFSYNHSITIRVTAALGLFLGSLCIQIGLAVSGTLVRRVLTEGRGIRTLNVLSGAGIVLFGVIGLLQTIQFGF